jgi:cell wall-associated NlpC family hydrolase
VTTSDRRNVGATAVTVRASGPLRLSGPDVARHAYTAGFRGEALVLAVAVAKGESGWDAHAVGDIDLRERGEQSTGLWQVHYRPSRDSGDRIRNPHSNLDPAFNARSAYAISGGGNRFGPWTVYTTGGYLKHMPAARDAVARLDSTAGPAPKVGDPGVPIKGATRTPSPVGTVRIGGADLSYAVLGGSIDFTINRVSELTVRLSDPDFLLGQRHRLEIGAPIGFLGLPWEVVEYESTQGPGTDIVLLKAHPTGVVRMREQVPAAANESATDYMRRLAHAAGLKFIGQPTPGPRPMGPADISDPLTTITRKQVAWEIGEQLAAELGFYAFEAAGTYYFANANYLIDNALRVQVVRTSGGWGPNAGPLFRALDAPRCRATKRPTDPRNPRNDVRAWANPVQGGVFYDVAITARLARDDGEAMRPGMAAVFADVPPFFQGLRQLVTGVRWSLDSLHGPVIVTAGTLEQKQGTQQPKIDAAADTSTSPARGTKSALDMVIFMQRQVGDRYIYGAETRLDDPDPNAFDCSELIQWACAQVGVDFVDGSAAQMAAVRRAGLTLSIADAAYVRGAVLYTPGHIAVSLGDGKRTIEARGSKYGVVEYVVGTGRFKEAGKIPGLTYPTRIRRPAGSSGGPQA